ncbi:NB-ARC domain-containing protein (plasmid) [Streptomyces sp. PCS3-D2]|uniref:AfsR/SARP family transcriptional regulator n=1 Tax=Streptomyces sp. PCS3-D2 TaxID=1460244 RepID=UPI000B0795C5|nr:BTAD domain-containing putative transcriptional regulator [Streptomyces sp. PCS3-D2]WKV76542.1 NB-ARC domain-containing protein [Streptomyces sp. PCS3-D2]
MKHQIVLASLLLSENRRASIGRLVDAVWGPTPPSTAEKQIRNAVSDLRTVIAPSGAAIIAVADGYRLDILPARLDLHQFDQHVARARTHLGEQRPADAIVEFRAALSLWSGPMLSGIHSDALQAQVAGVNEVRLSVVEECIDLELARDRHTSLISELAAWVAEYPLRERMVAQYVLALYRSGSRARAFAVYEQARRRLVDQLGLSPGPELMEIHQLMLREDTDTPPDSASPHRGARISAPQPVVARLTPLPEGSQDTAPRTDPVTAASPGRPPAPPLPDSLPPDIVHFVGREAEVGTLLGEAGQPGPRRVLAVDGMAGVGKTALLLHVAHRIAGDYPDGRYFLDLRAHGPYPDPLDHREALRRLLTLSGMAERELPDTDEELGAAWRARTEGRRLLVVLDNATCAEQIRPLLPAGDAGLTLVSSRRRLTMTTWSATQVLSLDVLTPADSHELFCRVLGKRHVRPDQHEAAPVLELCGHLPLAISAAAARLRRRPSWQLSHLAARLADPVCRLSDLRTEQGGVADRFDDSYHRLNAGQQRLMRLLGVAGDHHTDVATASVLAGLPVYVAEHMLEDLVDEHLLSHPEPGRYCMHPLVKTYCAQLRDPDEDGEKRAAPAPPAFSTARPTADAAPAAAAGSAADCGARLLAA